MVGFNVLQGHIRLNRKALNQQEFDELYHHIPKRPKSLATRLRQQFACKPNWLRETVYNCVPILRWLPKYERGFALSDMIAGLTLGVMVVPQGMAYASLAGLEPVYGLYSSLFPALMYLFLGTSRHASMGVFPLISLMINGVILRMLPNYQAANGRDLDTNVTSTVAPADDGLTPIVVVTALTLAVGIVQLLMVVLRLSFMTAYLSDQVIGGFMTAAAFHIFASQLDELIDVPIPVYSGLFKLYYIFRDFILAIPKANLATVIISVVCMAFLIIGKEYVNPLVLKRVPIPIPLELIAVAVATGLSALFKFQTKYNVTIVSHIPKGFPQPTLPRFSLMPQLVGDAVSIAAVSFVITISVGKLFAKKHKYRVDPSQELRALTLIQCVVSTLSCVPACSSLSRSVLNSQIGVKTQLSFVVTGSLLVVVILWLGPLLEPLPMSILACIIIVALKGMVKQLAELKELWPISKIDFMIWLVSFTSTFCYDIVQGLIISIVFALITIVFRTQWPHSVELANLPDTDFYRDTKRYQSAKLMDGVTVLRFDSPLLFANIEAFKQRVYKMVYLGEPNEKNEMSSTAIHTLVIDASGFTSVDCMGVSAMKEIYQELSAYHIKVQFASCKAPVRDLFEASGFYDVVPKARFYPSVHDAIIGAISDAKTVEIKDLSSVEICHL